MRPPLMNPLLDGCVEQKEITKGLKGIQRIRLAFVGSSYPFDFDTVTTLRSHMMRTRITNGTKDFVKKKIQKLAVMSSNSLRACFKNQSYVD